MERDVADIIDRASIACLKAEKIREDESIREWKTFSEEIKTLEIKYPKIPIDRFFQFLIKINDMIWKLESDVRQGKLDGALSEVGRRAIEIREHNNLRIQVKNIINTLCDTGFMDIKRDHGSQ